MGLFDNLAVSCPWCGKLNIWQSKTLGSYMDNYTIEDAPLEVLASVANEPAACDYCGEEFEIHMPRSFEVRRSARKGIEQ
jgi:uncharacterized Zn-finger protein